MSNWNAYLLMTRKKKLKVGDVFRFGCPDVGWGYGQVVMSGTLQYVVIFEPIFQYDSPVEDVIASTPLLAGWTMDGRYYSGAWEVVGSAEPTHAVILPHYKVGMSGKTWVTDVLGKPLRLASPAEERELRLRSSNSPILYEEAFRAHHKAQLWESGFDALLSHSKPVH